MLVFLTSIGSIFFIYLSQEVYLVALGEKIDYFAANETVVDKL